MGQNAGKAQEIVIELQNVNEDRFLKSRLLELFLLRVCTSHILHEIIWIVYRFRVKMMPTRHTCIGEINKLSFTLLYIDWFNFYDFSSQEEKDKWIEDLNEAIIRAKSRGDEKFRYPSLKSSTSKFISIVTKYPPNSIVDQSK